MFAWEFDRIPDEEWGGEPRHDWVSVLREMPAAITHSRFSAEVVRASLGADYPVWVIPAPLADRHVAHAWSARGWREPFELTLTGVLWCLTATPSI